VGLPILLPVLVCLCYGSEMTETGDGSDNSGELLVGLPAIARFLGVHQRTVALLIRDARLPVCHLGLRKSSTRRALLAWVEMRIQEAMGG